MTEGSFSFWSNYSDVDVIKNKFYSKIQLILKRDVVVSINWIPLFPSINPFFSTVKQPNEYFNQGTGSSRKLY